MRSLVWKVFGAGSAVLAGIVAHKVVTEIWRHSGRGAEIDPNNPDVPVKKAIVSAGIMALAVGLARLFATRSAANFYRRSVGALPDELQPHQLADPHPGHAPPHTVGGEVPTADLSPVPDATPATPSPARAGLLGRRVGLGRRRRATA
jgi:hypothetical protein